MSSQQLLQILDQRITQLELALKNSSYMPTYQPRFDRALFACTETGLKDYLQELQRNFSRLSDEVARNHPQQVSFLAERVVVQIEALQRELATQQLLRQDRKKRRSPLSILQQQLVETRGYEQRLNDMLYERESQLGQCQTLVQQQGIQQELVALEARLSRCRQALKKIEHQIEQLELGFS